MTKPYFTTHHCPSCGPWRARPHCSLPICPHCHLDPMEHRYIDRILADSTAVWKEENAEFQRKRFLASDDAKA